MLRVGRGATVAAGQNLPIVHQALDHAFGPLSQGLGQDLHGLRLELSALGEVLADPLIEIHGASSGSASSPQSYHTSSAGAASLENDNAHSPKTSLIHSGGPPCSISTASKRQAGVV